MTIPASDAMRVPPPDAIVPDEPPARILIVDDNASVLDAFRKILAPADELARLMAPIGTGIYPPTERPVFQVDVATSGDAGRDLVRQALQEDERPYAVAFVDLRMPGWDGLKTAAALWQADPDLQIVICTAFNDYTWAEIAAQLGRSEHWLVLKKPFDAIEVLQLAVALADKCRLQKEQRWHVGMLERQLETRMAEARRTHRTLRLISRCNDALVRSNDETAMLEAVCQHIIEDGDYALAWIGFAQHDDAKSIVPAAFAGANDGYLDGLPLTWIDSERGHGPAGYAIRGGRPVVCRHIDTDPQFGVWRDDALRHGFASAAALPLRAKVLVFGNLSIYARRPDAFDDNEIHLFQELADNIAFGIASLRDAEARARAERALEYQANYDALTGLPSRHLFQDRVGQALVHAQRTGRQVATLLLSVDRFPAIRETLGEDACNTLLKAIGERLSNALRAGDSVAHLVGEEFAIALTGLKRAADVTGVVHKLMRAVAEPVRIGEQEIFSSASVGISLWPADGDDVDALLRHAASALDGAQAEGGATFRFYASEMNARASAGLTLEADLRHALANGEFTVHYQPKVSLQNGALSGAEALIRWQHPRLGLVMPAEFIPRAEETGLIVPLGNWVIAAVCRQIRYWIDAGLPALPIAVNVSARQLRQQGLTVALRDALHTYQVDPRLLELEITESALMENLDAAAAVVAELKATGVQLTLDDFGTGHSSLSYLQRFPVDRVKIDQSFVRDITTNPGDAAICRAVVELAHALQLRVIAEGVETEAQMAYLRRHRCDDMQGYYFSRPLAAADFEDMVRRGQAMTVSHAEVMPDRTLLIVDDDPGALAALTRAVRREGFRVLTAGNAFDALELLAKHDVQVILSDQRMPEMNGSEFLARVRSLYPETIRIILSGYSDLETVVDAVNRGTLFKFLMKPWDDEALRAQLREAFLYHELRTQAAVRPGEPP